MRLVVYFIYSLGHIITHSKKIFPSQLFINIGISVKANDKLKSYLFPKENVTL